MSIEHSLWVEKYRPKTIAECILPEKIKEQVSGMVTSGSIPHLILSGPAGTGKTTLAKALCNELGADYIIYNGSDGSLNLEALREDISDFANTTSLNGNTQPKVIIIDEADGMGHLMQPALRNAMEKYSKGCRFILTCNYIDKIIEPLHSRCSIIDYKFEKTETNALIRAFAIRTTEILKAEGVSYDVESLKSVILNYFPDNRRILNEMQRYSSHNGRCIDDGIVSGFHINVKDLFDAVNNKDFGKVKQWVVNNNISTIFNTMYKECEKYIIPDNLPLFILKIAEWQKYDHSVPNKELNVIGCLTEYMSQC